MSVFSWDTIHYPTLDAYKTALLPFVKPGWISGITIHHSLVPTRAQWHGASTMAGTRQFYIDKGWSAGPHLFLAALTPDPSNDGIWAGTPLATPGIHAGQCNADHIGVEVVGDYDHEPWPVAVAELVYGVVTLLMQWGHILPARVQGHRECLNNKSCPGSAIDMNQVRAELARRLTAAPPPTVPPVATPTRYRVRPALPISQRSVGGAPYAGNLAAGEEVAIDATYPSGMAHLADGRGFVPLQDLEAI